MCNNISEQMIFFVVKGRPIRKDMSARLLVFLLHCRRFPLLFCFAPLLSSNLKMIPNYQSINVFVKILSYGIEEPCSIRSRRCKYFPFYEGRSFSNILYLFIYEIEILIFQEIRIIAKMLML